MPKQLNSVFRWFVKNAKPVRTEGDLGLRSSALASIEAAQSDAYRRGLEDQAAALGHQCSNLIWGHTAQALVHAMRSVGYSWKDRYAALRSFGLTPTEIQIHHQKRTDADTIVLTSAQRKSLDARIDLYRSEV